MKKIDVKNIIKETVSRPKETPSKSPTKKFIDIHSLVKKDHPVATEDQFTSKKQKAKRPADKDNVVVSEESQPYWRVTFKSKHKAWEVKARNTSEAIQKAEQKTAKSAPGRPIFKDIKRLKEEVELDEKANPPGMTGADLRKDLEAVRKGKADAKSMMKKWGDRGDIFINYLKEEQLDEAVIGPGFTEFKNKETSTTSKEDAAAINALFKQLSGSNKKKMEERLKSSKKGFAEILKFAKEVS